MAQTQRIARNVARTPQQARIARAIAIRRRVATVGRTATPSALPTAANDDMPADLLAACVAAGGFDQNAALGY